MKSVCTVKIEDGFKYRVVKGAATLSVNASAADSAELGVMSGVLRLLAVPRMPSEPSVELSSSRLFVQFLLYFLFNVFYFLLVIISNIFRVFFSIVF